MKDPKTGEMKDKISAFIVERSFGGVTQWAHLKFSSASADLWVHACLFFLLFSGFRFIITPSCSSQRPSGEENGHQGVQHSRGVFRQCPRAGRMPAGRDGRRFQGGHEHLEQRALWHGSCPVRHHEGSHHQSCEYTTYSSVKTGSGMIELFIMLTLWLSRKASCLYMCTFHICCVALYAYCLCSIMYVFRCGFMGNSPVPVLGLFLLCNFLLRLQALKIQVWFLSCFVVFLKHYNYTRLIM